MASSKVNKCNFRKRKLESDFIFEVNDDDCSQSPPPSPNNSGDQIKIISDSPKSDNVINQETTENTETRLEVIENKSGNETRAVLCCSETNKVIILSSNNKNVETKTEVMAGNSNSDKSGANDKFLFSLKFRDKNFADMYRKDIISAIMNCLDFKIHEELDEVGLKVKFWESNKSASDMEITSESEPENTELLADLFIVDTTPSSNKNLVSNQPKFYSRTKYVIEDEQKLQESAKETSNKKIWNPSTCFNCDGPHPLRDCKEPKNYKKINAARNRHKEMKSAKNTRYHLEDDQKYGHLSPGKISSNLREALGIQENEIPSHIYHMRRLGYPLGWLEASKKTASTLELYDFNGKNQNTKTDGLQYDLEKAIEYAGFNAPLPEGAKDLHSRYHCPPYSEKHSLKFMLEHLKRQTYTTPKIEKVDENSQNSLEGNNSSTEPSRAGSPTLTDLELQKKQLLDMLNNGISLDTPNSKNKKITLEQLDIETPPSIVKSSSFGTPILKTFSPFEKLPNPDNFSMGVSQVINFENLPDSTGKYEQMTNVLDKVRKTIRFSNSGQPPKNNNEDKSTT